MSEMLSIIVFILINIIVSYLSKSRTTMFFSWLKFFLVLMDEHRYTIVGIRFHFRNLLDARFEQVNAIWRHSAILDGISTSTFTPSFETNKSLGSMEWFLALLSFLPLNHSPNGVWGNDSVARFSFFLCTSVQKPMWFSNMFRNLSILSNTLFTF